ncbi:MAG TPA: TonB family protein [Terriglobales bacterium]|nr:TonB family protein [Terriglobales bacterium]
MRAVLAAAPCDPQVILATVARAAQSMTGCSGAAIAMRRDRDVVCLGSSGETAPPLGTRVSVDSGISGECLRSGKTLVCDDASLDSRADQEACRQLGLRSIAAVPVREKGETIGILEAFSTRPHCFTDAHIDSLRRLAEFAETASATPPADASDSEILSQLRGAITLEEEVPQLGRWQRYRLTAVTLMVLFVVPVVAWRVWHRPANGTVSIQKALATMRPQPASLGDSQPARSEAVELITPSYGISAAPKAKGVADIRARDSVARYPSALEIRGQKPTPAVESATELPPEARMVASSTGSDQVRRLISAPAALPSLTHAASSGFSGGVLVHKIQPHYPPQALRMRIAGTVILQATVAENGSVRDLKVKSGHPLLAPSAMEAVAHWRYQPFLINGKPFEKELDITINFELPQ